MIIFHRPTRIRFRRALVWLGAAVIGTAACGQAEMSAQTGSPSSAAQATVAPAPTSLVLEFDLPAAFAEGSGEVTGFRVGFFRANDSTPIGTIDVARDELTVRDRTGRVTVARENVPPCVGNCMVRVQTLSRGQASAWSNPVRLSGPTVGLTQVGPRPRQPRVARTQRPQGVARRPPLLTTEEIEKHGALSVSLREVLPPDANLGDALRGFRGVEELALAVVISRDYDIPLTTLGQGLERRPRVTLRSTLTKLRPDLDIPAAIRKSRAESRRLLATQETN